MNNFKIKAICLGLVSLILTATHGRSQEIFIDAMGPNNPFKASTGGLLDLSATLGTTPSAGFDHYFELQNKNDWRPKVLGLNAKATANNGWDALDEQVPQLNFDFLLNWSAINSNFGTWSVTLRGDGEYDNTFNVYDQTRAVGAQLYTRDWGGAAGTVYLGWAPARSGADGIPYHYDVFDPGSLAFRVGLGYAYTNSYASLKSVDVGKALATIGSQTVVGSAKNYRSGVFRNYNAYPVSFLMTINAATASPDTNSWARTIFNPKLGDYKGEFIFSPYFSIIPSDYRSPTDSVGLNVVLNLLNSTGSPKVYSVGVFVERDNAFRGSPAMTAGSALTLHF